MKGKIVQVPRLAGNSELVIRVGNSTRIPELFDIREMYQNGDGEWAPTRKGICFPIASAREVLTAALAVLDEIEVDEGLAQMSENGLEAEAS